MALAERPFWNTHLWPYVGMALFYRSLPLLGTVLFLYAGAGTQYGYFTLPLLRVVLHVLVIWLFSRWSYGFLKFWHEREGLLFSNKAIGRLRILVTMAMTFSIAYIVIGSMLGSDSMILFLGRLFFEIAFLIWTVFFSKALASKQAEASSAESPLFLRTRSLFIGFLYTVALVGFLVELAGYGRLALYWYTSWGRTVIVILWGTLFLFLLHQWHLDFARASVSNENGSKITARPIKWLLIRLGWVAWLGAVIIFFFLAWGAKQTVLTGFIQILSRPIQVGSIRFSLVGFVYAFLILLLTRTLARVWRHILERRILVDSGLEAGVQQSVTSITVYLLWALGILIALTALGFSTTSLTVALGALGVGLGFGLQNIFNNFVSGLILLFERPVQVGDTIDVNGTWGTIAKINVRSTVVQTYDNASLIIPNADMISNQVTNWSFKDLRLRRWITVGVAYGSDTELVRKTLLEIAHAQPKALKRPRPDVLFRDFGDSALIFSLRVWTTVDDFIGMETDIRLEIDRLFRERGIEIAFPQRDIHVRSVVEGAQPVAQLGRTGEDPEKDKTT
jgi:small-conductance mechanosensitive channel